VGHRTHVHTSILGSTLPVRRIVYRPPTDNAQQLFPSEHFQAGLVRQDRDSNIVVPDLTSAIDIVLCG